MKTLYVAFVAASLHLLAPGSHAATPHPADPTETTQKATARNKAAAAAKEAKAAKKAKKSSAHRARKFKSGLNYSMRVLLGLEERKVITSPAKLDRQLHQHQKHLKAKARMESKARRRRTIHQFN